MSICKKAESHCLALLDSRGLAHVYSPEILNSYCRKNRGCGNPFTIALNVIDKMIEQYQPTEDETLLIYEQYNP